MPFEVSNIEYDCFPNEAALNDILTPLELSVNRILDIIRNYRCETGYSSDYGYQQNIAPDMEIKIEEALINENHNLIDGNHTYSENLNEQCDVSIQDTTSGKNLYFEVEFRPNFEKDLVKFQIGYNNDQLLLATLLVVINRNKINPSYTTMPQYEKVIRVVKEFSPNFPLLLIGFDGEIIELN